jgi:Mce-associated membrane protein
MAVDGESRTVSAADAARARARAAREAAAAAIADAEAAEAEAEAEVARARTAVARSAAQAAREKVTNSAELDVVPPTDEQQDAEPGDAEAKPPRRRNRRLIGAVALVSIIALTFAGLSVFFGIEHRDARANADERLGYVQAARQGVVNILTVNFNTAPADIQRILDGATGPWRDEFTPQSAPFLDVVKKSQVVTTAEITDAGLEHVNDDGTAQVLVAAASKVSNAAGAKDDPRTFRVRVTVAPDAGRLKISKMEYIAS